MASGADVYRRSIRGAVRAYWKRLIDESQFWEMMLVATESGITRAWYTGIQNCGIMPSEMTQGQRNALRNAIYREQQWIQGFADAIRESEKLTPMFRRADVWIGRFEGARDEAQLLTCGDQVRMKWVVGGTESGCTTCNDKLDGQVRTVAFWNKIGVHPREHDSPLLACGGWKCGCSLIITDEPLSRGRFPSLP